MKKALRYMLLPVLVLVLFLNQPFLTQANIWYGSCGDTATWSMDTDTGLLTVAGTGRVAQSDNDWSFLHKYIKSAVVEEGITEIGAYTFSASSNDYLESVQLPVSLLRMEEGAFNSLPFLTQISIPYGVTEIPRVCFGDCTALASVRLPGSITCVGEGAFENCASLTDVYFSGTQAQWESIKANSANNPALFAATVHYTDALKTGWIKQGDAWYFLTDDGSYTGWLLQGKNWYYLDPHTKQMTTGWTQVGKDWYYMDSQGVMQTGWLQQGSDRYYLQPSGARKHGWMQTGSGWYYFRADGTMVTDYCLDNGRMYGFNQEGIWTGYVPSGFYLYDGALYFVKADGSCAKGWTQVAGYWYYADSEYKILDGWLELGDKKYYLQDGTGKMLTGWLELEGDGEPCRYYFHSDGHMATGWLQLEGKWYYLQPDGRMATGPVKVGKYNYFFSETGVMQTGWIRYQMFYYVDAAIHFYGGADGALYTGWRQIDGEWYYFYKDGHRAEGAFIGNYYMGTDGRISDVRSGEPVVNYHIGCTAEQISQAEAIARGIAQEAMNNGGNTDYDRVSYAVDALHGYYNKCETTHSPTGRQNSVYGVFVDGSGSYKALTLAMARVFDYMDISWQIRDGVYPCLFFMMDGEYGFAAPFVVDASTGVATGPRVGFGNPGQVPPYAYDYEAYQPQGTQGGWVREGQDWYFYDTAGKKVTGWLFYGNCWYYLKQDGAMKTGWLKDGGSWYYFNSSGAMKTGWLQQSGGWYYFRQDGKLATGTFKSGGEYYRADGNGRMLTGWILDAGKWYYAKPSGVLVRGNYTVGGVAYYFTETGAMGVGWFMTENGWHHASASGALSLGWKTIGGSKYYFYKDGHMATDTFIDNHFINEEGVYTHSVAANPDHKYYKYLTSQQAAQADAIAKAIAQEAMKYGGNTDREKIAYASQRVKEYLDNARYGNDEDYHYRSPYGVFVSGRWTCAGSARALGRVLDFMGYTWYHAGEDQWDHQWVCVKMDGEYGSVEPQYGATGCCYGNYLERDYDPFS